MITNSPGTPTIYSGTFNDVTDAPGNPVQYKFIINGSNWESIGNRMVTLAPTGRSVPVVFFNDIGNLGSLSLSKVSGGRVTATWQAAPTIRLQTTTGLNRIIWEDVTNSLGQGSATLMIGTGSAFFRLAAP